MGQWFGGMLQIPVVEAGYVIRAVDQRALLVATDLRVHSESHLQHRLQLLCGQTNSPMPPKQHMVYNVHCVPKKNVAVHLTS